LKQQKLIHKEVNYPLNHPLVKPLSWFCTDFRSTISTYDQTRTFTLCYYKVSFSLHYFLIKVVYVKNNHKQMLLVSQKVVCGHKTALVNHLVAAAMVYATQIKEIDVG